MGEREQKRLYHGPDPDSTAGKPYSWEYYLLGGNKQQLAVWQGQQINRAYCDTLNFRRVYLYATEYLSYGVAGGANVITRPDGSREYKIMDHLGTTRGVIGSSWKFYDYEPFGAVLSGTVPRKGFIDKERDKESGLQNMGVRQYDPLIGRFLSVDALWSSYPTWSPYAYGFNNPMRVADASGKGGIPFQAAAKSMDLESGSSDDDDGSEVGRTALILNQGEKIRSGYAAAKAQAVRKNYVETVSQLAKTDTKGRTAAKVMAREQTPTEYRTMAESMRPMASEASRSGGTASKTNSGVNQGMDFVGNMGKGFLVFGAAQSAYNISTAENTGRAVTQEAFTWAGAVAGGEAGAEIGAGIGVWICGGGAVPGAFIGGIVGGAVGGFVGSDAGGQAYDDVAGP